MAQFAAPLMVASSAVSAFGQIVAGQNQAAAYSQNARNEFQQAKIATQQATLKAGQIQDESGRRMGAQRAAYAGAGVDVGTGTPLAVMADTASRGAMASELAKYQGRINALSYEQQGDADTAAASAAKTQSYIGAASSLLGGAASAAGSSFSPSSGGKIPYADAP